MKEIQLTRRYFLRSIFTNGEVSKITKYYTLSHPFHINLLVILRDEIYNNYNNYEKNKSK
jgi:hypothetical protein